MSHTTQTKSRKIVLRASGTPPPNDMPSGEWIATCYRGEIKERGKQVQAILRFSILGRYVDGEFRRENEGVVLKQWYFLAEIEDGDGDVELDIEPRSKYGLAWAKAMGRPFKSGEDPSPKAFEKKAYRVDVGFRSNTGKTFSYRNLGRKKDESDFLRIHEIREKIDEKTLTHTHAHAHASLTSYNNVNVSVSNSEHEHDTKHLAPTKTKTKTKTGNIRRAGTNKEQVPQKHHANGEPGQPKDSPRYPTKATDDGSFNWQTGEQEDDGFEEVPR